MRGHQHNTIRNLTETHQTLANITRLANLAGYPISPSTPRMWVNRGKITPAGTTTDPAGKTQHTYRFGDALKLLETKEAQTIANETM